MPVSHADVLIKKYFIDPTTNRLSLPIDPFLIAEKEGISVVPLEKGDRRLSGAVLPETKTIFYNPDDSRVRRRFTVAHELGHLCLNHGFAFRDPSQNFSRFHYDINEVEANKFAAELLIPEAAIKILIDKRGITDAERLAKIFDVSLNAISYRLKNIGYA